MLDEFFSEFLKLNFPPEYVDIVNNSRDTLYNYGYSLVEANLYKTLPDDTELDLHTSKLLFTQCIIDGYYELLSMFGIRTDLRDIRKLDNIVRAIKNLEESKDSEHILNIINNDYYSQLEIVEKLLENSTVGIDLNEVMFEIELVNDGNFIDRIYQHHLDQYKNAGDVASDERPDFEYLARIREFCDKYPETIVARKLLSKDILFGETYHHYITENTAELELLYPNSPDKVPSEFVGLAIFANIQKHDISGHVKTASSKFYNDLRFSTSVSYLVDKFMEGMAYERKPSNMV